MNRGQLPEQCYDLDGVPVTVGTTSLWPPESAAAEARSSHSRRHTAIVITPGYCFRAGDILLTNFHLSRSRAATGFTRMAMRVCCFEVTPKT